MDWFYRQGNNQLGPVTWDRLLAAARTGELRPLDFVWCAGMANWQVANSVPGLFPDMPEFPPMPPGFGGFPPPLPPPDIGDDLGMRVLLPVGRSPWAIASGYLGLFSVLGVFATFAILTGILAIRAIRRDSKLHGMGRAIFGIVMGSLGTVLLLAMVVAILRDRH